jgi:hypothetical protein
MNRPPLEVADIVRCAGQSFLERSRKWISWQHQKVLLAITRCRTAALGGHRDRCTDCGHTTAISYNSCRNRHCPKCQGNARLRWLQARERELLPASYVHVVFTLPRELAPLALQNKRLIYNLLFHTSAATLLEIARDPRHLGAEIGFFSCMNQPPQPRIILVLRHVQTLCVSSGPESPASLLSSLCQPPQRARSRATIDAHSRQHQLRKSSGPAQPYRKPIGSRDGRLPSSRCKSIEVCLSPCPHGSFRHCVSALRACHSRAVCVIMSAFHELRYQSVVLHVVEFTFSRGFESYLRSHSFAWTSRESAKNVRAIEHFSLKPGLDLPNAVHGASFRTHCTAGN